MYEMKKINNNLQQKQNHHYRGRYDDEDRLNSGSTSSSCNDNYLFRGRYVSVPTTDDIDNADKNDRAVNQFNNVTEKLSFIRQNNHNNDRISINMNDFDSGFDNNDNNNTMVQYELEEEEDSSDLFLPVINSTQNMLQGESSLQRRMGALWDIEGGNRQLYKNMYYVVVFVVFVLVFLYGSLVVYSPLPR